MRASVAFAIASFAAAVLPASAQQLPRLNVASFTFSTDTAAPKQEHLFHLIIDVRLNGRVTDLESVVLPQLDTLEIAGDEKHTVARGNATEYREVIGVIAHRGGTISIPPAYLDAVDARDGKPKRFLSNPLTLEISGPASALVPAGARHGLMLAIGFVLGAILIVALALLALKLRKSPAPMPAEPAAVEEVLAQPLPPPGAPDAAEAARIRLSNDPTREGALAARSSLWASIGAGDGETLADVVRRPAAHDPALRAVLRAIERAAFTNDADRTDAIEDALRALDGYRA
jgi:hypothetical protein